jgi:hypothetical protein
MESYEDRLARFENGSPIEVIATLTNSINNFLNPEIEQAARRGSWSLMFMGIHAVALTVSKGFFGLTGRDGYLRFLRTFVDDGAAGGDFSAIGAEIHQWRNVVAHQWLSSAGYRFRVRHPSRHWVAEKWRCGGRQPGQVPRRLPTSLSHGIISVASADDPLAERTRGRQEAVD